MTHEDCSAVLDRIKSAKPKKFFLDTDTANEIDDQFAVAYSLLSDNVDVVGFGAAPFLNDNAESVADGMEKSYAEIVRVRDLTLPGCTVPAWRGADRYLPDRNTPVDSDAARAIIRACRETDDFVFVASIGCFTNAASALLLDPSIGKNMVSILIGANDADQYRSANDFNLAQDRAAAQVILESGTNVILLPAAGGTEVLHLTAMECAYALENKNIPVGDYLTGLMRRDHDVPAGTVKSTTHIIWDIASVAVLRDIWGFWEPEVRDALSVDGEGMFRASPSGGKMLYNKRYRRDGIFTDLFCLICEKAARRAG
ncbi:MAG: nucleoside hydrolase [Clostridia bacterium]|nr:nucleoside hydrolase [Clostridia bacterium]